jgi:hypothetical protein
MKVASNETYPQPPPQPQLEPQLQFPPQDILRIMGSCNLKNFYPKRERKLEMLSTKQLPRRGHMCPQFIELERQSNNCMACEAFTCRHAVGWPLPTWLK